MTPPSTATKPSLNPGGGWPSPEPFAYAPAPAPNIRPTVRIALRTILRHLEKAPDNVLGNVLRMSDLPFADLHSARYRARRARSIFGNAALFDGQPGSHFTGRGEAGPRCNFHEFAVAESGDGRRAHLIGTERG